jgi:chromosome segregation protein
MRLQRLEIAGFKSFSDRSELAFDDGVTAIVGPNGCGKSNVADAITWVLGEQSAKSLRGDRMEDVIFNGSDARKPTGSAEVRLLLTGVTTTAANGNGEPANGNGLAHGNGHMNGNGHANGAGASTAVLAPPALLPDEIARKVEVTRRLYRSGESEYLIDGHLCRLRDIHELLMDTGLGAKAYAIIEQGKIGMILSSRPADRRQLIEEAAGITKYKARRRTAELKLEAAQQNLTRVDDIVFEVEKQRGALKRQAAKARRYRRLREELRRWEKVLLAGRYRELSQTITVARERLSDVRARETAAAAHVAEIDSAMARVRIELAEAESRATAARETVHARELDIQRRQQQIELDRQQGAALDVRMAELDSEVGMLESRREPARLALESRREAARDAERRRRDAQELLTAEQDAYQAAASELEGLEGDVEAARSEMFAAGNAATALQHALHHAASARERVSEALSKLDVECSDLRMERDALSTARQTAEEGLLAAQALLADTARTRAAGDTALAAARDEYETVARSLRNREQEVAGLAARLRSLEELDAARAGYGDAARTILGGANGAVGQLGAVADYLEVDRSYERAVEAVLGDLLQHVIVPNHDHAAAGLRLVREHGVGRCGFLVLDSSGSPAATDREPPAPGLRPLTDVVHATGPHAAALGPLFDTAWIAETYAAAVEAARVTADAVATPEGDVLRGAGLVSGGAAAESRGILATKGEIRELRDRLMSERAAVDELAAALGGVAETIAAESLAVEAAGAELHRQEKAIVGYEAHLARAVEEEHRLARKAELLAVERNRAEEEGRQLDQRQAEARESISRIEAQQREADERFTNAQRRLFAAREQVEALAHRVSEAKAGHAGLVERTAGLAAEVDRLEEAARELEARVSDLRDEHGQKAGMRAGLADAVTAGLRALDEDVQALDQLREAVRTSEEAVSARHDQTGAHETALREARGALDAVRSDATELEVARATAEADLGHLAAACAETLQASLDEVLADVEQMERDGAVVPDARALAVDEGEEAEDAGPADEASAPVSAEATAQPVLTAEDAIAALRGKIDRLGAVNMMAIEQFEELETRHAFLTMQRKDLVDSIAQTGEAIKRIDETSKARFREAFAAINLNFQTTFATLFGGGRAGLTLLDDTDPLESGIDIVASPPGKRLQSVQLLSGGEKALTAIALMFAIFKYKPSPFCLLDEIDAPLDDANIGRFVEMLKGMLDHTQFILITHNRKTMEIADRLYGVTMEEPGVSKLISVRLN